MWGGEGNSMGGGRKRGGSGESGGREGKGEVTGLMVEGGGVGMAG